MPAAWQFQSHKEKALPQKGTKGTRIFIDCAAPSNLLGFQNALRNNHYVLLCLCGDPLCG
jgi:hypothetical protein